MQLTIHIFPNFTFISKTLRTDKNLPKPIKDKEAKQQIRNTEGRSPRNERITSEEVLGSPLNSIPPTLRIPQPNIDATDRRQIEAINEDKSHSTKETLDDIKRVHLKEKKKKEQNEAQIYQAGTISEGSVSINL